MRRFGLIGHPLGHSFSRAYFTERFTRLGIMAEYLNFDFPDAAEAVRAALSTPGIEGFNVTIPFKQSVIPLLHSLSDEAAAIGAVNTVRVGKDGHLRGFNTDAAGFRDSISPLLRPHHACALILGTGGAARAAQFVLTGLGLECQPVSRQPRPGAIFYTQVGASVIARCTVVVNCTPLGMSPDADSYPPLPYSLITDRHLLFDMVYNPAATAFMRLGIERGATAVNGLGMLKGQAEAAWAIWEGTDSL